MSYRLGGDCGTVAPECRCRKSAVMPGNVVKLVQLGKVFALPGIHAVSRPQDVEGWDKPGQGDFNLTGKCSKSSKCAG